MMGVLTQPSRKTSTCATLLSRPLISTASASLIVLACRWPGSRFTMTMRCWPAGSSSRMIGVTSAAPGARRATVCSVAWLMFRGLAADDPWRAVAPLPMFGLRACVAAEHCAGCGAAGEAAAPRSVVGVEGRGDRPALDRPGRGQSRRLVAHGAAGPLKFGAVARLGTRRGRRHHTNGVSTIHCVVLSSVRANVSAASHPMAFASGLRFHRL